MEVLHSQENKSCEVTKHYYRWNFQSKKLANYLNLREWVSLRNAKAWPHSHAKPAFIQGFFVSAQTTVRSFHFFSLLKRWPPMSINNPQITQIALIHF